VANDWLILFINLAWVIKFSRRDMNKRSQKELQRALEKNPSCYVLITCGQPSEDGQMQVEMTYQGDTALAAYLLQGAQSFINQEEEQEKEDYPNLQLVIDAQRKI
jgi:hypothetical protein